MGKVKYNYCDKCRRTINTFDEDPHFLLYHNPNRHAQNVTYCLCERCMKEFKMKFMEDIMWKGDDGDGS